MVNDPVAVNGGLGKLIIVNIVFLVRDLQTYCKFPFENELSRVLEVVSVRLNRWVADFPIPVGPFQQPQNWRLQIFAVLVVISAQLCEKIFVPSLCDLLYRLNGGRIRIHDESSAVGDVAYQGGRKLNAAKGKEARAQRYGRWS